MEKILAIGAPFSHKTLEVCMLVFDYQVEMGGKDEGKVDAYVLGHDD